MRRLSSCAREMRSAEICNPSGQSWIGEDLRIRSAARRGDDERGAAKGIGKNETGQPRRRLPALLLRERRPEKARANHWTTSVRQANSHPTHNAPGCRLDSIVHTRRPYEMSLHSTSAASSGSASAACPSAPMHLRSRNGHEAHDNCRPLRFQGRIARRTPYRMRSPE